MNELLAKIKMIVAARGGTWPDGIDAIVLGMMAGWEGHRNAHAYNEDRVMYLLREQGMRADGWSHAEIGDVLGLSRETVSRVFARLGIATRKSHRFVSRRRQYRVHASGEVEIIHLYRSDRANQFDGLPGSWKLAPIVKGKSTMRSLLALAILVLFAAPAWSATNCATPQSSLSTDNGFTFTMTGGPYTCGQYLDGTFWVLDPSSGGTGVVVSAISPATTGSGESLRNGYEKNRIFPNVQTPHLDARTCQYFDTYCLHGSSNVAGLPMTLQGGDSLIKVKSYAGSNCLDTFHYVSCIDDATVLTVVKTVPTGLGCTLLMRPPMDGADADYSGGRPTHFCFDSAQSLLNQNKAAVSNQLAPSTLATAWFGTGSAWIDACFDHDIQPDKCFPNDHLQTLDSDTVSATTYGAALAMAYAARIAWTTQGTGSTGGLYTWAVREPHARIMAQIGIDLWGAIMRTSDNINYSAGGAIHIGRKMVVVYASYVLNEPSMLTGLPSPTVGSADTFFEDGAIYRDGTAPNRVLWGRLPGQTVATHNGNASNYKDERINGGPGNRDGGNCRTFPAFGMTGGWVGQTGLSGPDCDVDPYPVQPDIDAMISANRWSYSDYQEMTGPYIGEAAVMKAMGLDDEFNNPEWFEYVARINSPPWDGRCVTRCSTFLLSYYRAYAASGGGGSTTMKAPVLLP